MRDAVPTRGDRAVSAAIVAATILRLVAVVGQRAIVYSDSVDYEHIDWWGGRRPWVTPVLYELVESHGARVLLQGAIGAACWAYLAVQAIELVEDRVARWVVLLGVLGLSLTTTVTSWDTTMLSESLALSLAALLTGALLRLWREPTVRRALWLVGAWALWLFTRQAHLVLSVLAVATLLVAVLVAARGRSATVRPWGVALAGVSVLTLVAGLSFREDTDIAHENLTYLVSQRIYRDAGDVGWFIERGMPVPDGAVPGRPASLDALRRDRDFQRWLHDDGIQDYARFLLAHPWESLVRPLEGMVSDRAAFGDLDRPDDVLLAMPDSYGFPREVLPGPVEGLLFEPGQSGGVLLGLAVALGATACRLLAGGRDRRWTLPLVLLVLQLPALVAVWHASATELGRLGLPSALLVRLALVLQLAVLLDVWLGERRRAAAAIL